MRKDQAKRAGFAEQVKEAAEAQLYARESRSSRINDCQDQLYQLRFKREAEHKEREIAL